MRKILSLLITIILISACSAPKPETTSDTSEDQELLLRIKHVEEYLMPAIVIPGSQCFTIAQQMQKLSIPGVSIAVINDGEIEWAKAYGVTSNETEALLTTTSLFQAASISKPISAIAALSLVEEGTADLNSDINGYLKRWKIPQKKHTSGQKVTLAMLLNHSSGITKGGYDGYFHNQEIPNLLEIIQGQPPANNPGVEFSYTPGTDSVYCGGGYTVLQLLLEDLSGQSFESVIKEQVIYPLNLKRSTFEQRFQNSHFASGHHEDGKVYEGGHKIYPELAAAGLWSTPSDLATVAVDLMNSYQNDNGNCLSQTMAEKMATPDLEDGYGYGFSVKDSDGWLRISHGGMNRGFRARFVAYLNQGKGAVIMVNSENGDKLIAQILRSISKVYHWPDYKPEFRQTIEPSQTEIDSLVGRYSANEFIYFLVTTEEDQLFYKFRSEEKKPLYLDNNNCLFTEDGDQIHFTSEAGKCKITRLENYRGNFQVRKD